MSLKTFLDRNPRMIVKTEHLRLVAYKAYNFKKSHVAGVSEHFEVIQEPWIINGYTFMDLTAEEKELMLKARKGQQMKLPGTCTFETIGYD